MARFRDCARINAKTDFNPCDSALRVRRTVRLRKKTTPVSALRMTCARDACRIALAIGTLTIEWLEFRIVRSAMPVLQNINFRRIRLFGRRVPRMDALSSWLRVIRLSMPRSFKMEYPTVLPCVYESPTSACRHVPSTSTRIRRISSAQSSVERMTLSSRAHRVRFVRAPVRMMDVTSSSRNHFLIPTLIRHRSIASARDFLSRPGRDRIPIRSPFRKKRSEPI
jgi:hypothetical protein